MLNIRIQTNIKTLFYRVRSYLAFRVLDGTYGATDAIVYVMQTIIPYGDESDG